MQLLTQKLQVEVTTENTFSSPKVFAVLGVVFFRMIFLLRTLNLPMKKSCDYSERSSKFHQLSRLFDVWVFVVKILENSWILHVAGAKKSLAIPSQKFESPLIIGISWVIFSTFSEIGAGKHAYVVIFLLCDLDFIRDKSKRSQSNATLWNHFFPREILIGFLNFFKINATLRVL